MAKSVRGKRVLVTGSAAGLGRDISLTLAQKGASLVLWDLNVTGNEETARLVREAGAEAETRAVNIADPDAFAVAAIATGELWGVVNNAGIVAGTRFLDSSNERNELTFKVNVFSNFYAAKQFLPAMIRANDGIFVSVASAASYTGSPGLVDYAASKAACRTFIETIAQEVAIEAPGVHVAVACPGPMDTALFAGFGGGSAMDTKDVARYIVNDLIEGGHASGIWPFPAKVGAFVWGILPQRMWRSLSWPVLRPLMKKHDMKQADRIFTMMNESPQQQSKL